MLEQRKLEERETEREVLQSKYKKVDGRLTRMREDGVEGHEGKRVRMKDR